MNVYEVVVSSEKSEMESWTVEAGSPGAAIGKVLPMTRHNNSKNVNATLYACKTGYGSF